MITEAMLDEIDGAMSDDDRRRLLDHRGGCMCPSGHPPCNACCSPLTFSEAEDLGLVPEDDGPALPPEVWRVKPEVDRTDYMAAVRDMSRGAGHG